MTTNQKREALQELGRKRQEKAYPGYNNIAHYHNGVYESEWVSPYTKSAQNVDADVFIMLQDWSSDDSLSRPIFPDVVEHGHSLNYPTNLNLKRLLKNHLGLELKDCFATNLFPFIKMAGMSATISMTDMVRATLEFALPQIEIVRPKIVIACGKSTFNALRIAVGLEPYTLIGEAIGSPFTIGSSRIYCQAHPGSRGQNMRNSKKANQVNEDWAEMKELANSTNEKNQNSINQLFNQKPISKMEIQKSANGRDVKSKFTIESEMQTALDLFEKKWVLDKSLGVPCNSPGKFFQVISTEGKRISIPIRNMGGNERQMSLAAVQEFFMGKKWFIKGIPYDIDSTYGDLNFCGGFAKYLKMLTEVKNRNQKLDRTRDQTKFTPENFERCFSILTSEIRKQGTITLVDNNNHNRTFHIVNDRIQLVCDNVTPPKISMAATRNIFLFGQHTGEKNEKKYHINGWYKDHMNYWIAIAKHLRSICQKL